MASELTARFHGTAQAKAACAAFLGRFQKGEIPDNLVEQTITCNQAITVASLLKQLDLTKSTSESIRLTNQGAVKLDGERVTDASMALVPADHSYIVQVGKRRIARVRLLWAE